jgi:hypothetical protein
LIEELLGRVALFILRLIDDSSAVMVAFVWKKYQCPEAMFVVNLLSGWWMRLMSFFALMEINQF